MTSISEPLRTRSETNRILSVVRLHFTTKFSVLVLPWLIMLFILLVNLTIWALILSAVTGADRDAAAEGLQYSGAVSFIFVYMMVVAVQAVNITFSYALGLGSTRRDYSIGTVGFFALLSVYYSLGMTVLAEIEVLTDGWGLGGRLFDAVYLHVDNPAQRFLLFFLLFVFFFFVGSAVASVYVRWKSNGMIVFFALLTLLVLGAVALPTFTGNWPAVGAWFVDNGPLGVASWMLIPALIAAVCGYLLLRRATPRR